MSPEKKKKLPLLVRLIALCCVGVFLGYNLYLWNAETLKGNVLPMPFGTGAAVILSGSMEPALSVDDLIIVQEQDGYEVGDVVVYQSGTSLVVHRIVRRTGDTVVTQGDANNVEDAEIDVSQIKGLVTGRIKNVGWAVRLLKAPMVSFGVLALVIWLLERSFRRDRQEKRDERARIEEEIRRLKEEQERSEP